MPVIPANLAKNKPPYRVPCGGQWTGEIFIPQFAHYRGADANLPFLKNVTQIFYPECPAPQQLKGPGAIPNCDYTDTHSDTCASPCGIHSCAPCSSDFNFGPPGAINCFQKTKQTVNRASCLKIGFKNVQAFKVWHGANGWLDSCPCSAAALAPPATRYLQVQAQLDVYDYAFNDTRCIGCCDEGDTPVIIDTYYRQHDAFSSQVVIGRTNGQATVTQVSQETQEAALEGSNPCTDSDFLSCSSPSGNCPVSPFTWGYYTYVRLVDVCDPRYIGLVNTIVNACPQNFSHHINSSGDPTAPFGISSIWGNPGVLTVSVSETVIQLNYQDDTIASGGTGIVAAITITLSSPYAGSDCVNDCIFLLAQWNLTDDLVYPFRTDTMVNLAPLVTYDESNRGDPLSAIISPPGTYGGGTGTLLGAPTPCNAAQGCCDLYWNPTHPNYSYGIIDDEGDMGWILGSYGAYSPPWCPQATQWTDNFAASSLYGGAWMGCGGEGSNIFPFPSLGSDLEPAVSGFSEGCYMQKWAETKMFTKPSHNFARPCGADRLAVDQTTINCATGNGGTFRWPDVPCDCDNATNNPGPAAPAPCPPPTGETPNQWNDTGMKGDWAYRILTYNARDIGEYYRGQNWTTNGCPGSAAGFPGVLPRGGNVLENISTTQSCSKYLNCCPVVICFSPNASDTWTNGVTLPMPATPLDYLYGSFAYADVWQFMVDPLYQTPACQSPAPAAPLEECRVTLPAGAPALPAGIILGVEQTGNTWTGPMAGEPEVGGAGTPTAWTY